MVSDFAIRSCNLSSMLAVRMRSCRIDSALPCEKMPMNDSIPVLVRISLKSWENPAVTSSSPMISSAMFAFIAAVWAWTSSSEAFSMSTAISSPVAIFWRAASIRLVTSAIFA